MYIVYFVHQPQTYVILYVAMRIQTGSGIRIRGSGIRDQESGDQRSGIGGSGIWDQGIRDDAGILAVTSTVTMLLGSLENMHISLCMHIYGNDNIMNASLTIHHTSIYSFLKLFFLDKIWEFAELWDWH